MNRPLKNRRKPGASAERSQDASRPGTPVTRKSGREHLGTKIADSPPANMADTQARVIRTNS